MVKPQQLQRFEDGKNWSMATTDRRPIHALYWSWRTSSPSSRLLSLWIATGCQACSLSGIRRKQLGYRGNQFAGCLVQGISRQSAISRGVGPQLPAGFGAVLYDLWPFA